MYMDMHIVYNSLLLRWKFPFAIQVVREIDKLFLATMITMIKFARAEEEEEEECFCDLFWWEFSSSSAREAQSLSRSKISKQLIWNNVKVLLKMF
jgi:hypothetical protein